MAHQFTHLHVHTDASLIDGLGTVESLVKRAKALGFDSLAITDHGTLANTINFLVVCEEEGIKPIVGVEGYLAFDGSIGHITLLADGNEGWESLVRLQNLAHESEFKRRPAFTFDQLFEHADGLVCLSGCPASPFSRLPYAEALALTSRFRSAFGNRFFIEVMLVGDAELWERPLQLARDTGLRTVLTNDVHFKRREDADVHRVLTSLKAGFDYNSHQLWLKTPSELEARMAEAGVDLKEAMTRSWRIGQKLKPVELKRKPWLPTIDSADDKLWAKVNDGFAAMLDKLTGDEQKAYRERLEFEMSIITSMDFSTYFLILDDIVTWARDNGVRVGPGRGSGSGSLVLHCIGITKADPMYFGLSFERFLNPSRKGFPDVDIDFDPEGRHRVLAYAAEKWNAVGVATFSRYSHRSLLKDLAKYFKVPNDLSDKAGDRGHGSDEFKEIRVKWPQLAAAYDEMLGQIRHKGKHPGGIIITDGVVPIERAGGGELIAGWTEGWRKELSYAGIVKFDMLGLASLGVLKRMEDEIGLHAPMPHDDAPEFELFREGNLVGVFQFTGSDGIVELTKRIAPTTFEDIVAATALFRPGALDAGTADKYPEWKLKPRKIHPLVDSILEPTYGIIVYQEQVMAIFAAITGGTLAEADLARRTIIIAHVGDAKWESDVAHLREQFIEGAKRRGLGEELGRRLWLEIQTHTRYSFNKGHAVSYSLVSWEMAWWKYNYPVSYYTALLNVDPGESLSYVFDAVRAGIELVPPNVNFSGYEYANDGNKIYMPLSAVKWLGEPGALAIVEARKDGKFATYEDYMARVPKKAVNARARNGLFALGAFDGLEGDAEALKLSEMPSVRTPVEVQREWLGFVIPTKAMLARLTAPSSSDVLIGIVANSHMKKSVHGPYKVFRLMPAGSFWTRDWSGLDVGDIVKVKKSHTGRAVKLKRITI